MKIKRVTKKVRKFSKSLKILTTNAKKKILILLKFLMIISKKNTIFLDYQHLLFIVINSGKFTLEI
ncbi:hypothetical protein G9C98_003783 [Cotesia typhae]|uniref:Uncharacterized protein n=1 Tax=Cotesia typhae TaxID=2053667 RepID=A0A8J5QRB1_9HYME|nr:hypothetical protein G9C98_003783 [Cotesia typhae]